MKKIINIIMASMLLSTIGLMTANADKETHSQVVITNTGVKTKSIDGGKGVLEYEDIVNLF